MTTLQPQTHALRSASEGLEMAREIIARLRNAERFRVDFAAVEMMSPSFANALIMTLLEQFSVDQLRANCEFANRTEVVIDAMNRAAQRYQSGIRLTTQRLPLSA
jgi:hypothetical protein